MIQSTLDFLAENWRQLLLPIYLLLFFLAAGWTGRRIVFNKLRRWAESTGATTNELLVESLHGPFLLWTAILAIYLATELSKLPQDVLGRVDKLLEALWIISITLALARLSGRMVRVYGSRLDSALPMGTLMEILAIIVVSLIGLLTLLDAFDISIRTILGALGIGGLAIALALQDTLSNFFAGFYVSLARQIRLGDFIKLQSTESGNVAGHVIDISWRSTTLREPSNNLIVIPNNKLAQSIVTNYSLPEKRVASQVTVGVSYDSDPTNVERILADVAAAAIGQVPGLLKDPAPVVRLSPGFGESSLDFSLNFHVVEYHDQFLVQHELRKRIFRRFRTEGIEIPFPTRTVEFRRPEKDSPPQ